MKRSVLRKDLLAPRPMTQFEVRQLVERVRALTTPGIVGASIAMRARWERYRAAEPWGSTQRKHPTCLARVGARYAMLSRCSLNEAARVLRAIMPWSAITAESIRYHWNRLYPDTPTYRAKRWGGARPAGVRP